MARQCSNEFCDQPSTVLLINGSEVSALCDACLRVEAGNFVADNDTVEFTWNDAHTIVDLSGRIVDNIADCVSCDGYVLNASEAPYCPSCARERKAENG
jgi:hypothetical protein